MVKKSKKSKSKRMPLRKKYKILRKVRDHNRKKAKEAKKLGKGRKPKAEKDPGIPNAWPFKEQELQALEARRARALEELERKKQAKKERAEKRKLGLLDEDEAGMSQLAQIALQRQLEFEKKSKARKENASGTAGRDGSQRAFYKELLKVIEASDVILEVLDARDPLGCRCLDLERLVLKAGPTKNLVLLLNKIDLVPREVAEKWLKYLREELPTIAFKCSTQQQKSHLGQKSRSKATEGESPLQTSECLGAETLLQLLKNYSRNQKLKTAITVGVVGLPNVGKSSLINSMKRTRVVNVGATPGVTRVLQEIQLDKHVKLLDCPGVVLIKASDNEAAAVLRNSKKIEKLEDPFSPVKEILRLCPSEKLMSVYKVPRFSSLDEFLQQIALVRGKLKKGGIVDLPAAARIVLRDWNEGKIPYYTLPPVRQQDQQSESVILSEWSREFNVEEVYQDEQSTVIAGLPSLVESTHVEMPASVPLAMELHESETEDEGQDYGDEEQMEASEELGPSEMDTTEAVASRGRAFLNQNDKLYEAEGIHNPHLARAERKRRKKASKPDQNILKIDPKIDDGSDYDFDVDYADDHAILPANQGSSQDEDGIEPMAGIH